MDKISSELKDMARQIIEDNKLSWVDLEQIEFVSREKKTKDFAEIRMVKYPTNLYTDKTFILSTFEDFDQLSADKKKIVMFHELLHISADGDKLINHDVEDFRVILEKFGIDWKPGEVRENEA